MNTEIALRPPASYEISLDLSNKQLELIALDWLFRTIVHRACRTDLHILKPEGEFIRDHFHEDTLVHVGSIAYHSMDHPPQERPTTVEAFYGLIESVTKSSREDILDHALRILKEIIAYVNAGYEIVYREPVTSELRREFDVRLPFPSLHPKEERRHRRSIFP